MADNVRLGKEEEEAWHRKCNDNDNNDDNVGYGGCGHGGRGGEKKGKRFV